MNLSLWYYTWNKKTEKYYSRPEVGNRHAGVDDFKLRGFDRIVVLDNEGTETQYSGSGYENGKNDGMKFAGWCTSVVSSIPYYVTIPFFKYGDKRDSRDTNTWGFYNTYWHGWIDGVLSVPDTNRIWILLEFGDICPRRPCWKFRFYQGTRELYT
ncbi:hypothetical protein [Thermococcus sp.]|uniref:hypothetical protein n=1 Tax=Thermococcus sp. TaxID=35749 RepID=UPI00261741FB|nr:hypothetical protein [Thermococcus sp.]